MKIGVMLRTIDEKQGIGVYTQNLMDQLLPLDKKNQYVLFYRNPDFVGRYAKYANVKEKLVTAPNKVIWDQVKIPLEARREGLDLIFHTKFTVPFFTRCKTVMSLHGSEWFVYPKFYPFLDRTNIRIMMSLYCKKAVHIVSNSDMTKQDYVRILGVDEKKIDTVHFGVDSRFRVVEDNDTLERIKVQYQLPDKFILFVGRIYPGKNFGGLLQAFSKIHTELPHKIVVAGHPRWGFEQEYSQVKALGLQDKVIFKDWVPQEDLVGFYNLADLFVYPSFYEAFGIPILESMASGCPVLASETGAVPEVSGGAAFLIDPHDPQDLASGIQTVLTDEVLRQELVKKGLLRVKEFSWQKAARQTLEALEHAGGIKSRSGSPDAVSV